MKKTYQVLQVRTDKKEFIGYHIKTVRQFLFFKYSSYYRDRSYRKLLFVSMDAVWDFIVQKRDKVELKLNETIVLTITS